ncbi:hypothetical protein [Hymenobacter sp. YC55]|uniref:hypothetical protein n=1 Tax=Hymenobacter sp. YC55 TaxID=3034019 RepID=UPI0023F81EA3|nr:hypothetical protein [Hymenobacter sp. YC55]MDF7813592.1 hypothetical protein [Hymenobacter sp. YC55]
MALTKAKLEVYKILLSMAIEAFNKFMQFVLALFAMYWFGRSMEKYIMSNTELEATKWAAANGTFAFMIFAVYAYFFKKDDKEKKEASKLDKIVDAAINRWSGNNPPPTSP